MTLPAWRPLKDAPRDKQVVVDYSSDLTIAHPDGDKWIIYCEPDDERILTLDPALYKYAPIADTYELDRAVQGEIARAFGALIQAMVDAEYYLSIRGPNSSYDLIYEDAASTYRAAGLRTFARTLHTAMGGRIPDEVP